MCCQSERKGRQVSDVPGKQLYQGNGSGQPTLGACVSLCSQEKTTKSGPLGGAVIRTAIQTVGLHLAPSPHPLFPSISVLGKQGLRVTGKENSYRKEQLGLPHWTRGADSSRGLWVDKKGRQDW